MDTLSLTDSIAFDSKINELTKVKPPTKEETHSLTLIIMLEQNSFVESLYVLSWVDFWLYRVRLIVQH